jgi:hypothetical protein
VCTLTNNTNTHTPKATGMSLQMTHAPFAGLVAQRLLLLMMQCTLRFFGLHLFFIIKCHNNIVNNSIKGVYTVFVPDFI